MIQKLTIITRISLRGTDNAHQPKESKSPHNENITIEGNKMKLPKLALVRFAKSLEVERRIVNYPPLSSSYELT